ncbi:unnamed protein product, partial [Cladocopium goreaui]
GFGSSSVVTNRAAYASAGAFGAVVLLSAGSRRRYGVYNDPNDQSTCVLLSEEEMQSSCLNLTGDNTQCHNCIQCETEDCMYGISNCDEFLATVFSECCIENCEEDPTVGIIIGAVISSFVCIGICGCMFLRMKSATSQGVSHWSRLDSGWTAAGREILTDRAHGNPRYPDIRDRMKLAERLHRVTVAPCHALLDLSRSERGKPRSPQHGIGACFDVESAHAARAARSGAEMQKHSETFCTEALLFFGAACWEELSCASACSACIVNSALPKASPYQSRVRSHFLRCGQIKRRLKEALEGFVEQYLLRYLGDYIFGVDKQNLSVTTWRGEIHLRSARLKQEVVELLNLPFKLIFGEAADLKINVPWNRLGSRPVVVELTGLRVLLGPKPATEWSNEEELRRVQLARQRLVDRADLLFGLEASPDDRKEGYLGRLVTRISDNLELQLRDLHIRFQDDSPAAGGPPVSGGLHLASLEVQSTGSDWQPSFIERSERSELFKLLQLRNLSCYHEPPGWAARSEETDAIRRCFLDWPKEIQLKQGRIVYLLPPCSGQLKLTQALDVSEKSEEPRFDLQCELEPIKVLVSSASYRGVCGIMSLVSEYFAFQEVTRHWIQSYWPYRPVVHVHGNSLLWWRYAFRCIRAAKANVRAPAKASRFIQLLTEENLSRLRLQAEYCTLVVKSRSVQLPEHEQARLQRLRVSLPATELLRCHAMALERLQAQGEASADPGRWSFWGRTKVLSVPSSPSLAALEAPAVEDEILEGQSGHSGPCEVHRDVEREDLAFKYRPSVGSWLMPRPCRIPWPDAEAEGQGFEEGFEELDMLDMAEGAAPTSCLPLEFDAVRCYAVMFESVLDMLLNLKKNYC